MGSTLLETDPLDATFGATIRGVRLAALDDAGWRAIHEAWLEFGLLIFPGQFLSRDEQDEFALRFGALEFKTSPISNIARDGTVLADPDHDVVKSLRGNEGWHHDSTYMPLQAKGAVLSAEIVPSAGAATGFADMRAAYEALDVDTRQRVGELSAFHSLYYSQGRSGYLPSKRNADGGYAQYGFHDKDPSLRPLVKVHPDTARPNLLIGRHAYGIVGMDPDESERLLDDLNEWACQPPRVHHHQWEVGDARGLRQPAPDAPGDAVRHDRTPTRVAHTNRRRTRVRTRRQPHLSTPLEGDTIVNNIKQAWASGKPAINGWLAIPSGFSAEMYSRAGWDSVTVDMQHGVQDYHVLRCLPAGHAALGGDAARSRAVERAGNHRQGARRRRVRRHLPDGQHSRRGASARSVLSNTHPPAPAATVRSVPASYGSGRDVPEDRQRRDPRHPDDRDAGGRQEHRGDPRRAGHRRDLRRSIRSVLLASALEPKLDVEDRLRSSGSTRRSWQRPRSAGSRAGLHNAAAAYANRMIKMGFNLVSRRTTSASWCKPLSAW